MKNIFLLLSFVLIAFTLVILFSDQSREDYVVFGGEGGGGEGGGGEGGGGEGGGGEGGGEGGVGVGEGGVPEIPPPVPQAPFCGDGIVQAGEQCDDGNNVNGDGCSADCKVEFCGDGILQPGEECEPPGKIVPCVKNGINGTQTCSSSCKLGTCQAPPPKVRVCFPIKSREAGCEAFGDGCFAQDFVRSINSCTLEVKQILSHKRFFEDGTYCLGNTAVNRDFQCFVPNQCVGVALNATNCNSLDGFYNTSFKKFFACGDNPCELCENIQQEFRDYSCKTFDGCIFKVKGRQFVETGVRTPKICPIGKSCEVVHLPNRDVGVCK